MDGLIYQEASYIQLNIQLFYPPIIAGIISSFVFPSKYGLHIKSSNYYTHWVRYRNYHNMCSTSENKTTPYGLRHTFVSVVKTLPEGLLKQLVGHSESMDTFGTYSHELERDLEKAAQLVQDIFENILK